MGGGRALLLQLAHPLVAAGVAQHSDYQARPWDRLFHTLDTTVKIVFGDRETSRLAADRLRRRHDAVRGVSAEGVAYDARDPQLLVWVWATLVDTSLTLYERCLGTLAPEDRDRFYEEQKLFAYACGVPPGSCPPSFADFGAYWNEMVAQELRVTEPARAVRDAIAGGVVPAPLRPAVAPHTLVTAGLLPPNLRAQYGFAWGTRQQRLFDAWFMTVSAGMRIVPKTLRVLPADLAARGRR
jgi:uncharacterized protein (DUF2236 family)